MAYAFLLLLPDVFPITSVLPKTLLGARWEEPNLPHFLSFGKRVSCPSISNHRILGSIAAEPVGEGHIDSTYIKARCAPSGAAVSPEGSLGQGIDLACGGRATKIYALVDGGGEPVAIMWTPANMHGSRAAAPLFFGAGFGDGARVVGGKSSGSVGIRTYLEGEGASLVSPPKKNAKNPEPYDKEFIR